MLVLFFEPINERGLPPLGVMYQKGSNCFYKRHRIIILSIKRCKECILYKKENDPYKGNRRLWSPVFYLHLWMTHPDCHHCVQTLIFIYSFLCRLRMTIGFFMITLTRWFSNTPRNSIPIRAGIYKGRK